MLASCNNFLILMEAVKMMWERCVDAVEMLWGHYVHVVTGKFDNLDIFFCVPTARGQIF